MKTDTPKTDQKVFVLLGTESVDADFARELERENARLREALETVRNLCTHDHESKAAFIHRVLLCLPNVGSEPREP